MTGTIILTGAAGGLGTATAHYLAKNGYDLVITDIFKPDQLLVELNSYEIDTAAYALDVTDRNSIITFVEAISDKYSISGLVTLAGITRDRTIKKMTIEEWEQVIDVNLHGTFFMIKEISPMMEEDSSIVTIGSVVARFGNFGQANYVASKAAVEGITKVAARELAKKGIRVNCILPGFIQTPMTDEIPRHLLGNIKERIPLGRVGKPEEIASTIEFLLSEKSSYITGSSFQVNGGLWMG